MLFTLHRQAGDLSNHGFVQSWIWAEEVIVFSVRIGFMQGHRHWAEQSMTNSFNKSSCDHKVTVTWLQSCGGSKEGGKFVNVLHVSLSLPAMQYLSARPYESLYYSPN